MNGRTPTLPELLAEPARALTLPQADAVKLLAQVAGLHATLHARVAQSAPVQPEAPGALTHALLSVPEAASLAGVTPQQFLRRQAFRPAVVRQGHRTLRVNAPKLRRIL